MKRFFTIFLLSGLVLTGCRKGLDDELKVDDMRLLVDASIAGSTQNANANSANNANSAATSDAASAIARAQAAVASLQGGVATKEQSASLTKRVWVPEDQFGLFLNIERDGKPSPMQFTGNDFNGFNYDNLIYTYRSNVFNALAVYYYPFRRNLVDLYAVYPYDVEMGKDATQNINGSKLDKSSAGNYPWNVFADQTKSGRKTGSGNATTRDESNVKQGDLLFAKQTGVVPNSGGLKQNLDFKHMMSKIHLKLLVPTEFDNKVLDATNPLSGVVLMNTVLDSRVNFQMDSVFTYGTTTTSISMLGLGSESDAGNGTFYYFECVAVPQTVVGNTFLLQAMVRFADGSTGEFKMTLGAAGIQFLQGKQHDLTVVFDNKKGLRLDGSSIKDWETGDGGGGLVDENESAPAANSFIVSPGEKVVINSTLAGNDIAGLNAYTRALKDPVNGVKSVRLLWQTKDGHTSDGALVISSITDTKLNAVVVQTNGAATKGGNAVVAAYSGADGSGNILWSWHIWVTADNPINGKKLATYGAKFAASNGAGKAIMDRNLGALTATQSVGMIQGGGLLYQWGRKDPFAGTSSGVNNTNTAVPVYNLAGAVVAAKIGSPILGDGSFKLLSSTTNNVDAAIGNPMTFYAAGGDWTNPSVSELWNEPSVGSKTIYDPCPDGFRVMGGDSWKDFGDADGFYGIWTGSANTASGVFNELGGSPMYFSSGRRDGATGVIASIGASSYIWTSGILASQGIGVTANPTQVQMYCANSRSGAYAVRCVQHADITAHLTVAGGGAIAPTGGSTTINVYSNSAWSATISGAGFTLGTASGNGNGTITVNATAIAAGAGSKTGVVTVTGASGTIVRTTYVSQHEPTVAIGDVEWTAMNLTGAAQGDVAGFTLAPSPTDYGMFWKWGSVFAYEHAGSANPANHWNEANNGSTGAATQPVNKSDSYDYANISSLGGGIGGPIGDPCQSLGANYKTPTHTQWQALVTSGKSTWTTYQNRAGYFFGLKATSCNNTTIQDGCIFLPAVGRRSYNDGSLGNESSEGSYWSSSVYNSNYGWRCYFNSGGVYPDNYGSRGLGLSVRCIKQTVPTTVTIAGMKWTTGNLTGVKQGDVAGFTVESSPTDYGMFWKWGSVFAYEHAGSANPTNHWNSSNNYSTGAATYPSAASDGYDYANISSLGGNIGGPIGDPCKALGANYKTPTHTQWQALVAANSNNSVWVTLKPGAATGVTGRLFGVHNTAANATISAVPANCIFLPAAGLRNYSDGSLGNESGGGYYWSSSVYNGNQGWFCSFSSGGVYPDGNNYRGFGFSVRCVQE